MYLRIIRMNECLRYAYPFESCFQQRVYHEKPIPRRVAPYINSSPQCMRPGSTSSFTSVVFRTPESRG